MCKTHLLAQVTGHACMAPSDAFNQRHELQWHSGCWLHL